MVIVLGGECPGGNCPGGNCPGGGCPGGGHPVTDDFTGTQLKKYHILIIYETHTDFYFNNHYLSCWLFLPKFDR